MVEKLTGRRGKSSNALWSEIIEILLQKCEWCSSFRKALLSSFFRKFSWNFELSCYKIKRKITRWSVSFYFCCCPFFRQVFRYFISFLVQNYENSSGTFVFSCPVSVPSFFEPFYRRTDKDTEILRSNFSCLANISYSALDCLPLSWNSFIANLYLPK